MNSYGSPGLADPPPPTAWLETPDGRRLACTLYAAPEPWLCVLVSHGFAEHRGWWVHVAEALRARGITVYTFDHFHHGRSSGRPGDVRDYAELTGGLRLALEQGLLPARPAGVPVAVLAHSNGGLIALRALRELPPGLVAGLVLSGPLLGLPALTLALAWPLARLVSLVVPGLRLPLRTMPWRLTGHRAIWPQYRADPLRCNCISARYFLAMLSAIRRTRREATCGGIPLLVLTAGRERIVHLGHLKRWFRRVDSPDKEHRHYPRLRHELFNETRWGEVLDDTVAWLRARFQARPGKAAGVR